MINRLTLLAIAFSTAIFVTPLRAQPILTTLAPLAGFPNSYAMGLNAEGTVVVGYCETLSPSQHGRAMSWRANGLPVALPLPTGTIDSNARRANATGDIILGNVSGSAAIWKPDGSLLLIPHLPGSAFGAGFDISASGDTVVGYCNFASPPYRAFRWTQSGGTHALGIDVGVTSTLSFGVSGDGLTAVGTSVFNGGGRLTSWNAEGSPSNLGFIPPGGTTYAYAATANGDVIVGFGIISGRNRAFRWTNATGMIVLSVTPDWTQSAAGDVAADGGIVVGYLSNGVGTERAMLWSEATDTIDLNDYLINLGVDLTGWTLSNARAISEDGSTIAGYGFKDGQKRGFVVRGLPSLPRPCDPDLNQDGNADAGDIDVLVTVIAGGQDPPDVDPDFNRDGVTDEGDIDALINVVAGGQCP